MTKRIAALLVTLGLALAAQAQTTTFTYQGNLMENGAAVTGAQDFEFRLFGAVTGGAQIGSLLTLEDVGVTNGLFTVPLDFGATFDGSPRFLDIAVRPGPSTGSYTQLTPRQAITATPYALKALEATTVPTGTITSAMLADGAVTSAKILQGAVTTGALADGAVTGAKILQAFEFLSTIVVTNPTPLAFDQFGSAVATVGADKILVGASQDDLGANNAGVAHLFSASGNLLLTLTNPTPAADDAFGSAVGAVGSDRLLVGAPLDDTGALNGGIAYLYSANGALLLTITNPSPSTADGFGSAVAAVGSGHFLIGAFRDNPGTGQFGAAYLYDLTGVLVSTITNPAPANLDLFGTAVAAVGADKVLIGASADDLGAVNAGAAYLFNTNGVLLMTIPNPAPAASDSFGEVVAAVGTDRVLIGAPADDFGAADAGAAYLFDLSGTLLTTFANPDPTSGDRFGNAVIAVGANTVLIGAERDDAGAGNAGAAYLFDLSGRLLLTLTNPAPGVSDEFGTALAAFDGNRILIGALQDDLGTSDAGGAYLLAIDDFTSGIVADGVRFGSVNSASLAEGAVTSDKIAAGAITSEALGDGAVAVTHLAPDVLNATFWRLDGNSGVSATTQFLGTTDAAPLVLRAGNRQVLKLEGVPSGIRIIAGVNSVVDSSSTNSSILGGRDGQIAAQAHESTIAGGLDNVIRAVQRGAFIGGGARNEIRNDNDYAVIAGGRDNRIGTNTVISLVVGGAENVMQDNIDGGVMIGGFRNDILGSNDPFSRQIAPILIGGSDNEIGEGRASSWAIILGGDANRIGTNCASAVILGGTNNLVADNAAMSLAAGRRARVNHQGAFVWADSQNASFASADANTFNIRSEGGVHLSADTSQFFGSSTRQMLNLYGTSYGIGVQSFTMYFRTDDGFSWFRDGIHSDTQNSPGTGGTEMMRLNSTGLRVNGTFVSASDRNIKSGFTPVDTREILAKVAALPITRWKYTNDTATPHVGPVAQDFHAAFGVGSDDKHISMVDADGVALAAIQGLNQKVEAGSQKSEVRSRKLEEKLEQKETEIAELKQQNTEMIRANAALLRRLEALEARLK